MTPEIPAPPMRPSPLALTVLSLLAYEPLHPYRMQRLMQLWGKDRVVNVGQRANLYKTIKRLHEAGLMAVRQTERDQPVPRTDRLRADRSRPGAVGAVADRDAVVAPQRSSRSSRPRCPS